MSVEMFEGMAVTGNLFKEPITFARPETEAPLESEPFVMLVDEPLAAVKSVVADGGKQLVASHRVTLLTGAVIFVAAVIVTATTSEVYDDPWILYRYASNLADGHGWTFNVKVTEPNAVTSPLMVLSLAALLKIGVTVTAGSAALFCMGTWAAAQFAFMTLDSLARPTAGFIAAALILSSAYLSSLRGMESAVLLGAIGVALWAVATNRDLTTGVALGTAVLARPDCVLLAACVLIFVTCRRRSIPLKMSLGSACVVAPWIYYAQAVLHSPLPSTLAAKQAQRESGEWRGLTGNFLQTVASGGHLVDTALICMLATVGLWVAVSEKLWPIILLLTAWAGTFMAYEFLFRVAGYPWYAASGVYVSLLLGALGMDGVAQRTTMLRVGALALTSAIVILAVLSPIKMSRQRQDYARVATWLSSHSVPESTVAAAEIGRLGYLSDRRMIDYLGLLDTRAVAHMKRQDWEWWVNVDRPDYWVTFSDHNWGVETTALESAPFQGNYRLAYRTDELEVYARVRANS